MDFQRTSAKRKQNSNEYIESKMCCLGKLYVRIWNLIDEESLIKRYTCTI